MAGAGAVQVKVAPGKLRFLAPRAAPLGARRGG
jgi:hypothetical protein